MEASCTLMTASSLLSAWKKRITFLAGRIFWNFDTYLPLTLVFASSTASHSFMMLVGLLVGQRVVLLGVLDEELEDTVAHLRHLEPILAVERPEGLRFLGARSITEVTIA